MATFDKRIMHWVTTIWQNFKQGKESIIPMALWRIVFGLLLVVEAWGAIATGWVRKAFIEPKFHFVHRPFDFLQPLEGEGMLYVFIIMGILGLGVMLGFFYRISVTGYFFLWTYVYLMQKASYNNHYYLMVLLLFLMILMPVHRALSLDARAKRVKPSNTIGKWARYILIALLLIVYTYASLNKIYPDWLDAKPLEIWMKAKADLPIIGPYLQAPWLPRLLAYGGIFFDGLIIPMLLWRRTRWIGVLLALGFHLVNSIIFQIGIFPYMMIGSMVLFFPPELIQRRFFPKRSPEDTIDNPPLSRSMLVVLLSFLILNILLPLRHHLMPGDVTYTEEGHKMSWRMMLRAKAAEYPSFFEVVDTETGVRQRINAADYLTDKQLAKVFCLPDMTWQFAQMLKEDIRRTEHREVAVYVTCRCSINGNEAVTMYDESVDLTSVPYSLFQADDWIIASK